jgi:hypothetical protein
MYTRANETASHADLAIVCWLAFFKRANKEAFDRILSIDPTIGELYNACKKWLEKDD